MYSMYVCMYGGGTVVLPFSTFLDHAPLLNVRLLFIVIMQHTSGLVLMTAGMLYSTTKYDEGHPVGQAR